MLLVASPVWYNFRVNPLYWYVVRTATPCYVSKGDKLEMWFCSDMVYICPHLLYRGCMFVFIYHYCCLLVVDKELPNLPGQMIYHPHLLPPCFVITCLSILNILRNDLYFGSFVFTFYFLCSIFLFTFPPYIGMLSCDWLIKEVWFTNSQFFQLFHHCRGSKYHGNIG
jgi:hypothetical protein